MTPSGSDARHRRALVLSEVVAEGVPGLSRVLRRAAAGDEDAAGIPVATLVHALPGVSAPAGLEFLVRARIGDTDLAGDLTPGQRVALLEQVDHTPCPDHPLP